MKKLSSSPNTLILIWLKGFIQIYLPVILHKITVSRLFWDLLRGHFLALLRVPHLKSTTVGTRLVLLTVLKYKKMLKYAGNAAKLYSKVSSVTRTEDLKPDVNINQKWFMNVSARWKQEDVPILLVLIKPLISEVFFS